ncbi:MAG: lipase secretion chaperone [Aquabacterium sp.]|jgi:lipase chaperone LimK
MPTIIRRQNANRPWLLAVGAAIITVVAAVSWSHLRDQNGGASAAPATHPSARPTANDLFRPLDDVKPDGQLTERGQALVLSPELLRRFDHYLSMVGQVPLAVIRERILADLSSTLSPSALAQATDILDRYLAFKKALTELPADHGADGSIQHVSNRIEQGRQIRLRYFSPAEIRLLFDADDAVTDYRLARVAITSDRSLSSEEQQQRLRDLNARTPAAIVEGVEAPFAHVHLQAQVDQARQQGASDQAIFALREQAAGTEAAQRLAALDREEADWRARIAQYQQALAQGPEAAAQARARLFSPQEQLRLAAYER